jgi:hypothetical protein
MFIQYLKLFKIFYHFLTADWPLLLRLFRPLAVADFNAPGEKRRVKTAAYNGALAAPAFMTMTPHGNSGFAGSILAPSKIDRAKCAVESLNGQTAVLRATPAATQSVTAGGLDPHDRPSKW